VLTYLLFFIATILAGTINALAGGGGLITFPLLMLVLTPVTADATSAVALFFAYPTAVWRTRSQLEGVFGRIWLWLLLIPSVLGGLIGGVLLSRTDNRNFIISTVASVRSPLSLLCYGRSWFVATKLAACIPISRSRCGLSQLRAFF